MALREIAPGVLADTDGLTVTIVESDDDSRRMRSGAVAAAPGPSALGALLQGADFEIVAELAVAPIERPGMRRADAGSGLAVEAAPGEDVVVLVEGPGGTFHWSMPIGRDSGSPMARSRNRTDLVYFDLSKGAGDPIPSARRQRGPIGDWIIGKLVDPVRTLVLRFVVSKTIDAAVRRIEGGNPTGPVVIRDLDPEAWIPAPLTQPLPQGAPLRVLLMVHGTFSSTAGSFGALTTTAQGRRFLEQALDHYDLVLGHDHKTLADEPQENARAILSTLTSLKLPPQSTIDAVAFSRGGLVYRVLAEELLPTSGLDAVLGPAIFVGCTNGGTNLAEPENWAAMIDIYTNIVLAAGRAISGALSGGALSPVITFAIQTLGRFVQMFSQVAITERRLPGLAAMEPDGDLVVRLNKTDASPLTGPYFAITSSFSFDPAVTTGFSRELLQFLADRVTDRLMGEPNDLVVHSAAMTEFGPRQIASDAVHAFGEQGSIYHTVYFGSEDVAERLFGWLGLDAAPAAKPFPTGLIRKMVSIDRMDPGPNLDFGIATKSLGVPSGREGGGIAWTLPDDIAAVELPEAVAVELPEAAAGDENAFALARPSPPDALPGPAPDAASDMAVGTSVDLSAGAPPDLAVDASSLKSLDSAPPVAPPTLIERHVAAEMEPYPPHGRAANIYVTVSPEQIAVALHAAAATSAQPAKMDAAVPLDIHLIPMRNCKAEGPDVCSLDISRMQEVVARLRVSSIAPGEAQILIEARQRSQVLASFTLRPVFIDTASPPLGASAAIGGSPIDPPGFPVLRIYEFSQGSSMQTLRFDLVSDELGFAVNQSMSLPAGFSTDAFVKDIFDEIEQAWADSGKVYSSFLAKFRAKAIARTDAIIPREIREMLWDQRDNIKAIQVISEEALLPWELMYIADPSGKSAERRGFLSEWGLVRWLHGAHPPGRRLTLDGPRSRYVIPDYLDARMDLPGAAQERAMLEQRVSGIAPVEASSEKVEEFLSDAGDCGLLHFACHGLAEQRAVLNSELLMQGLERDGRIIDDRLSVEQVKTVLRLSPEARTIVFLNSCQTGRVGEGIAGVSGFADAFLRPRSGRGASVFVGALWSINDTLSMTFADSLYEALQGGSTLVDATRMARQRCQPQGGAEGGNGDFTWLAYTVYGHPGAKLG